MKPTGLTLVVLACIACSDDGDSEGIHVDIAVASAAAHSLQTTPTTSVVSARVTVVGWELERCDALSAAVPHNESSPTSLGVPVVIDLQGARATTEVGTLEPPPGRYCGLTLEIGPADDDAVGLPDDDMVGLSLRVSTTGATQIAEGTEDHAHVSFATPLELSAEATSAKVTVAVDTTRTFPLDDFMSTLTTAFTVAVQ